MRKSRRLTAIAGLATLVLALAACGDGGGGDDPTEDPNTSDTSTETEGSEPTTASVGLENCTEEPNTCNSGEVEEGGTYTHTIEKDILNWNPLSVDGNVFDNGQVLNGIYQGVFTTLPDTTFEVNDQLMESAEITSEDPFTIEYVIRNDAVWNDGEPVDFDDFDYTYKTQNPETCPDCIAASNSGYDQIDSLEGSEDGKTVTAVFKQPYTDWASLFGPILPAHIAAEEEDISKPAGLAKTFNGFFGKTVPTWSMAPYLIDDFEGNVAVTLVPNDQYWGDHKAKLDQLVFRIITDSTQEPTALQNREVQGIYPQPQVDLVEQVQQIQGVSHHIGLGLTWEHYDLNLQNEFFKQNDPAGDALRRAIFVAANRDQLIERTVGQFAPDVVPIDNHNFMPGQEGYEDVLPDEQGSGDTDAAIKILEDAGYTGVGSALKTPDGKAVPAFKFAYTTGNTLRQQSGELLAADLKPLGIKLNIQATDDLGTTLVEGDYDIIIFAWVGTPFPYTGAQQLWSSTSGSNFGKYKNKQVDELLNQAAANTDVEEARSQLNEANALMADAHYVLPLFQKPTFLAVYDEYANIRDNPTATGPSYNVGEWGVRAQ